MKKCYINGTACVSAQKTFDSVFMEGMIINETENVMAISEPDYKEFIPPAMGRRMAKVVKNGIAASSRALKEAGIEIPDAIITGTGLGCSTDSEKFLKAILDNKEEFLTPTSFIQSTHNTVGAQIALGLQCKAYNFTYVNGSVSFESSLIDAQLQIEEGEASAVLVGGIEEAAENTLKFMQLSGIGKATDEGPYSVLEPTSGGAVLSEGAVFFVLADHKQESSYAELKDISIYNALATGEVEDKVELFLKNNNIDVKDIDAVVLGYNGDIEYDEYYRILAGYFEAAPQIYYKHLCGEFNTASAFGLWAAAKIIKAQHIPEILKANILERPTYRNILLYNQYRGRDHSFTLISACS
jgi:3-oxoacyl-(acyl-carrier-protein) synthase